MSSANIASYDFQNYQYNTYRANITLYDDFIPVYYSTNFTSDAVEVYRGFWSMYFNYMDLYSPNMPTCHELDYLRVSATNAFSDQRLTPVAYSLSNDTLYDNDFIQLWSLNTGNLGLGYCLTQFSDTFSTPQTTVGFLLTALICYVADPSYTNPYAVVNYYNYISADPKFLFDRLSRVGYIRDVLLDRLTAIRHRTRQQLTRPDGPHFVRDTSDESESPEPIDFPGKRTQSSCTKSQNQEYARLTPYDIFNASCIIDFTSFPKTFWSDVHTRRTAIELWFYYFRTSPDVLSSVLTQDGTYYSLYNIDYATLYNSYKLNSTANSVQFLTDPSLRASQYFRWDHDSLILENQRLRGLKWDSSATCGWPIISHLAKVLGGECNQGLQDVKQALNTVRDMTEQNQKEINELGSALAKLDARTAAQYEAILALQNDQMQIVSQLQQLTIAVANLETDVKCLHVASRIFNILYSVTQYKVKLLMHYEAFYNSLFLAVNNLMDTDHVFNMTMLKQYIPDNFDLLPTVQTLYLHNITLAPTIFFNIQDLALQFYVPIVATGTFNYALHIDTKPMQLYNSTRAMCVSGNLVGDYMLYDGKYYLSETLHSCYRSMTGRLLCNRDITKNVPVTNRQVPVDCSDLTPYIYNSPNWLFTMQNLVLQIDNYNITIPAGIVYHMPCNTTINLYYSDVLLAEFDLKSMACDTSDEFLVFVPSFVIEGQDSFDFSVFNVDNETYSGFYLFNQTSFEDNMKTLGDILVNITASQAELSHVEQTTRIDDILAQLARDSSVFSQLSSILKNQINAISDVSTTGWLVWVALALSVVSIALQFRPIKADQYKLSFTSGRRRSKFTTATLIPIIFGFAVTLVVANPTDPPPSQPCSDLQKSLCTLAGASYCFTNTSGTTVNAYCFCSYENVNKSVTDPNLKCQLQPTHVYWYAYFSDPVKLNVLLSSITILILVLPYLASCFRPASLYRRFQTLTTKTPSRGRFGN